MRAPADPRLILALGGLAARSLEGLIGAPSYIDPETHRVAVSSSAIRTAPDGFAEQVDQLLFGERFLALQVEDGWAFGQAVRDGYVGWVERTALKPGAPSPTHRVSALRAYALAEPRFKAAALFNLSLNALVAATEATAGFVRADGAGWIPERQLTPIGLFETDPAAVAERYLGAPYLWGGRDGLGVDCSGLVQQALYACGRGCPRDSDQQASLGAAIERGGLRRNDLVFWRGHVGLMLDAERLIHAHATDMAVVIEPLEAAIARKRGSGGGEPTGFRRLL